MDKTEKKSNMQDIRDMLVKLWNARKKALGINEYIKVSQHKNGIDDDLAEQKTTFFLNGSREKM